MYNRLEAAEIPCYDPLDGFERRLRIISACPSHSSNLSPGPQLDVDSVERRFSRFHLISRRVALALGSPGQRERDRGCHHRSNIIIIASYLHPINDPLSLFDIQACQDDT